MKKIFISLIAGILIFSPLCRASGEPLLTIERVEKTATQWPDRFSRTQDVVSERSNGNEGVLNTSHLFLSHLYRSYCAGEGMIDKDILRILEAVKFAAQKHQKQTRKDPQATPYIIHPIGVADHLLVIGSVHDPDILIGALLHDTVEDTDTSFEEIRTLFGPRVEGFVREVTDDTSLPTMEKKALQITHAPEKSAGAAQIKLADKLYNLNDLLHAPPLDWSKERVDAYFAWADKVVHALPWVNASLINAVDETIASYRKK